MKKPKNGEKNKGPKRHTDTDPDNLGSTKMRQRLVKKRGVSKYDKRG